MKQIIIFSLINLLFATCKVDSDSEKPKYGYEYYVDGEKFSEPYENSIKIGAYEFSEKPGSISLHNLVGLGNPGIKIKSDSFKLGLNTKTSVYFDGGSSGGVNRNYYGSSSDELTVEINDIKKGNGKYSFGYVKGLFSGYIVIEKPNRVRVFTSGNFTIPN